MRALGLAVVLAVLVAGCGSGGSGKIIAGTTLSDCLGHASGLVGVSTAKDDMDLIAQDAGDMGIHLAWEKNAANVVVERTASDAQQSAKGYRAFGVTGDRLLVSGNVVVAFDKSPTGEEHDGVTRCE